MAKRPSRAVRGAASTRPAWTRLGILGLIVVALYAAMIGSGHLTPKLGLDLQGGTSVTLKPKLVDANGKPLDKRVSSGQIEQAVDIIRQRVNGLGVSEAEVVRAGSNIEISVPGKGRQQVVDLVGQTAQLAFRIPYSVEAASGTPVPTTPPSPAPSGSATPSAAPSGAATPTGGASPTAAVPSAGATSAPAAGPSPTVSATLRRAEITAAETQAPVAATGTPAPSAAASPGAASPGASATPSAAASGAVQPCVSAPGSGDTPPACIQAQMAIQLCDAADIASTKASNAPDSDWLVACERGGAAKYILRPASLKGTAVSSASSTIETSSTGASTGRWVVSVDFTNKGQTDWSNLTEKISTTAGCPASAAPECSLAIVLDGVVQSAPTIQGRIPGSAQITGNFTQKTASDLANVLKYGALPIAFDKSEAVSVSATLGSQSLHAGLLAGGIGLALVVLYSFLYYRAMGIITVFSLLASGLVIYASVVLLGQLIGFTLTLAGIAGFIVAVGITADSFVVYYERLKDEVHEGRSVRTSVERSWTRARRTILSADTVSFLAAAALYWLSIGSVRGFAFTLGLSTLIDLLIVFLFTKPMVTLLVRRPLFSTSRFSGLTSKAMGMSVTGSAEQQASGPAPRTRLTKRAAAEPGAAPAPPPAEPGAPARQERG